MSNIFKTILDDVFETQEKIVAKIKPEALGARAWLVRHGFEKLGNTDRGRTVWKLEKRRYLNGR